MKDLREEIENILILSETKVPSMPTAELQQAVMDGRIFVIEKARDRLLALLENSYKEREKKIFKKLENEIINAFMKVVGTVWGIEMGRGGWTDADSKLFNNTAVNIRNNLLEKLQALERTK